MRAEKKWPGDRPDIREPPEWGGDGIWVCWKKPGILMLEGKKYPKVRGKAEKKFGCAVCDKKLSMAGRIIPCNGPRHFHEWTMDALKERFGGKAILEEEPLEVKDNAKSNGSVNSGGRDETSTPSKSEVIASGRVEGS